MDSRNREKKEIMKQKDYIETCWEEIEQPRSKRTSKQLQSQKKPVRRTDNDMASPVEIAVVIIAFLIFLFIVVIGTALK